MEPTKVQYVVRNTEESTIAIVEARVTAEVALTMYGFCTILKTALTNWFHTTSEGKAAWEASSQRFNVGDLSEVTSVSLMNELERVGITNLSSKVILPTDNYHPYGWTFCEVLRDEELAQILREQSGENQDPILSVGDTVMWRGAWGAEPPFNAKVMSIEKVGLGVKNGVEVESIPWSQVKGRNIVVTLDNQHWAYGSQLERIIHE